MRFRFFFCYSCFGQHFESYTFSNVVIEADVGKEPPPPPRLTLMKRFFEVDELTAKL